MLRLMNIASQPKCSAASAGESDLTGRAIDWPWSSTRALVRGMADGITAAAAVLARYPDFAALLALGEDEECRCACARLNRSGGRLAMRAFSIGWRKSVGERCNVADRGRGRGWNKALSPELIEIGNDFARANIAGCGDRMKPMQRSLGGLSGLWGMGFLRDLLAAIL